MATSRWARTALRPPGRSVPSGPRHALPRRRASARQRVGTGGTLVLATLAATVGLGSATALAFWTAGSIGGSGTAAVAATTVIPLTTATATASSTSLLYPGGPAADVTVTVRNANPFPVNVTGVTANGAATASGGIGGCTTTGVSFVAPTAGLPFTVPAKVGSTDGTLTRTLTAAASMSSASETGCQKAVFALPLAFTGVQG